MDCCQIVGSNPINLKQSPVQSRTDWLRREAHYNVDLQLEEPPVTRYRYRRCGRAQAGCPLLLLQRPLATLTMSPSGSPIEVDPSKGYWVIAQSEDDLYPNDEFGDVHLPAGAPLRTTHSSRRPSRAARRGQGGRKPPRPSRRLSSACWRRPARCTRSMTVSFEVWDYSRVSPDIEGRMSAVKVRCSQRSTTCRSSSTNPSPIWG